MSSFENSVAWLAGRLVTYILTTLAYVSRISETRRIILTWHALVHLMLIYEGKKHPQAGNKRVRFLPKIKNGRNGVMPIRGQASQISELKNGITKPRTEIWGKDIYVVGEDDVPRNLTGNTTTCRGRRENQECHSVSVEFESEHRKSEYKKGMEDD